MPGRDGFELAHEIRNAPNLTGAIVMMLTLELVRGGYRALPDAGDFCLPHETG